MLIRLFFTKCINAKATPTNNTDYSFYIEAVELVQPIIWEHMKALVINTLRGTNTHTQTHQGEYIIYEHTYRHPHRLYFKKPGAHLLKASARLFSKY